ncbi:hypothetical protein FGB62_232g04 [Gracilaria domingensis]|nr:hypothetical protein FGB62_232g04 [Gracilaria domingensis]
MLHKVVTAKRAGILREQDIMRGAIALYNGATSLVDVYRAIDRRQSVFVGPSFKFVAVWKWMAEATLFSDIRQTKNRTPAAVHNTKDLTGARNENSVQKKSNDLGHRPCTFVAADDGDTVKSDYSTTPNLELCVSPMVRKVAMEVEDKKDARGDERPIGTKRAKLKAKLVACLDKGASGMKILGEASIERNKLKRMHLDIIHETHLRKQKYIDIEYEQDGERYHLHLLNMDIST